MRATRETSCPSPREIEADGELAVKQMRLLLGGSSGPPEIVPTLELEVALGTMTCGDFVAARSIRDTYELKSTAFFRRGDLNRSRGYCKDRDPHTAHHDTVEPLPFRRMSGYPYPASERFPEDDEHRRYLREWNMREVLDQ